MGTHPLNLTVRFLLEMVGLIIMGVWGWQQADGWLSIGLVIAIPLIAAIAWGTFNVPGDPSRSGQAPVAVPGFVRLLLELAFFAFATWAFYWVGYTQVGLIFGVVVISHYIISYDRVGWLLR